MSELTQPIFAAPDDYRLQSLLTSSVDRYKLVEIMSDQVVVTALLQISFSLNDIHSTEQFLARLLELICGLIDAERGAILLATPEQSEFEAASYSPKPFGLSPSITRHVFHERVAALSDDGNAVLCVPFRVFDRKLGVIYADHASAGAFDQTHLNLLIAISALAAVAFQQTRLIERLESENQRLVQETRHAMVGESAAIRNVYQFIGKAGPSELAVLILGQSGTGKELVARAIHDNSPRSTGPYVAVNCGAIVDTLAESELFGHEKGAFTGAIAQQKGKIEAADGGTLFLDEVGELTLPVQVKLLRVLQERTFQRVGGTRSIQANVRVIAATNRDLEARIKEGRFRQDLYFRLNVLSIRMPSLTDRRDDILILAEHFIRKHRRVRIVSGITSDAKRLLTSYDWPGNVRELENAIECALALGSSDYIRPEDLPEALIETKSPEAMEANSYHAVVNQTKRSLIERAFHEVDGNVSEAARILNISHSYLHRLIRNLNIKLP